jgi:hypothetical protein
MTKMNLNEQNETKDSKTFVFLQDIHGLTCFCEVKKKST